MAVRKIATEYEVARETVVADDTTTTTWTVVARPYAGEPRAVATFDVDWWGEDVAEQLARASLATIQVYVRE